MSAADRALEIFRAYAKTRETRETRETEPTESNKFNKLASVSPVSPSAKSRETRETNSKSLSGLEIASSVSPSHLTHLEKHKPRQIDFAASELARLNPDEPPCNVPAGRWATFIADGQRFLTSSWVDRATALNWAALDLFGCDRNKPFARIDRMGLLWQIQGQRLLALSSESAVISTATGGSLTYRRLPQLPGRVLAWQLASLNDSQLVSAPANAICAQCKAGSPDDPPTVSAWSGNTVIWFHAECHKIWIRNR
jgi:hypothetical protein